jgi:hypothetical protein
MQPKAKDVTAACLAYLFEHGYLAAVVITCPGRYRFTMSNFEKAAVIQVLRAEADSLERDSHFAATIEVEIGDDHNVS